MKLLNGQNSFNTITAINEHFISGVKPSNLTVTLVGTGAVNYQGAALGTGKIELTATALNDNAAVTFDQPLRIDKWKKTQLEFRNVKSSTNDFNKSNFFVGLRFDGSNFIAFMEDQNQQVRCVSRYNGVTTTVYATPFNPTYLNRYKLIVTTGAIEFYVNESLVANITTNIPIDKALSPRMSIDQRESTNPKKLECGSVGLWLDY